MDKQEFINYINEELGLYLDETSPAYPYIGELYEALLPYEKELKAGTYRLLSSDNYEDCYDDFSNKIADIDAPHWFDITVYRAPQSYKYYIEFKVTSTVISYNSKNLIKRRNKQMLNNITLNYTRINKSEARKLYNLGRPIVVLPCKANPNSPWFSNSTVTKESTDKDFDTLVNEFTYYNCNTAELGRRPAFYVLTINE